MVLNPPVHDRPVSWLRIGLVAVVAVVAVTAIVVFVDLAVRHDGVSTSQTSGSGVATTEYRELVPFSRVELAGANIVTVRVEQAQSVAVTADDNLVDHVTTTVRSGSLVIADDVGSFTAKTPMTVTVSVRSPTERVASARTISPARKTMPFCWKALKLGALISTR